MRCEHFILKTYLREKQSTTRIEIIVINANNLKITNKIVTIAKAR